MMDEKNDLTKKESLKEWFMDGNGPSFVYEDGRVTGVKKTPPRPLLGIYCALMDVSCPNLPRVLSLNATETDLAVVVEYIPGRTLQQVMDEGGEAEEEAVFALGRDICAALQVIHSMTPPVIHRDIKPSNIILSDSGSYVLIDFDVSRRFAKEADEDTTLLGTFGYAAPEQYGFSQTDARSDIFSLGATMYEYRTGLPYKKDAGIPGRLGDIIAKSTAFDPKDRYQTAGELARALDGIEDAAKKKKRWPVFAAAAAALLCAALIPSLNKATAAAAADPAGEAVNVSSGAEETPSHSPSVFHGMVPGIPDGLHDQIVTEDEKVRLLLDWNGSDTDKIKITAEGSNLFIRIMKPLDDEDWLPENEKEDLNCPFLQLNIKADLSDDPNVVSYRRLIAEDDDKDYYKGIFSIFNRYGERCGRTDENFPYEKYRYDRGEGVFRQIDYQWLDKDGSVVGEYSFSVTVSLDEGAA